MDVISHLGLVDLVIGLLVVGSVLSALRRRAGLLGALASGVGTVLVLWILAGVVMVWGPASVDAAVSSSAAVSLLPPPTGALRELVGLVSSQISTAAGPAGSR